ncbi:hypothetical protein G6F42_021835 [Rhizopus arrhizus]|nr:hypothetical protein G6F42_021835 [Rhizopus arrhizus]
MYHSLNYKPSDASICWCHVHYYIRWWQLKVIICGPPCHRISLVLDVLASSFGAASYPNGCLNGFPGWATFCAALDISGTSSFSVQVPLSCKPLIGTSFPDSSGLSDDFLDNGCSLVQVSVVLVVKIPHFVSCWCIQVAPGISHGTRHGLCY